MFRFSRRRKLLYELNSTGKYFAFKEQLKHSVIKIVREKFLRTTKFNNPDEFQVSLLSFLFFDMTMFWLGFCFLDIHQSTLRFSSG